MASPARGTLDAQSLLVVAAAVFHHHQRRTVEAWDLLLKDLEVDGDSDSEDEEGASPIKRRRVHNGRSLKEMQDGFVRLAPSRGDGACEFLQHFRYHWIQIQYKRLYSSHSSSGCFYGLVAWLV